MVASSAFEGRKVDFRVSTPAQPHGEGRTADFDNSITQLGLIS